MNKIGLFFFLLLSSFLSAESYTFRGPSAEVQFHFDSMDALTVDIYSERLHITSLNADEETYRFYARLFGDPIVMEKYALGVTRSYEDLKKRIETSWAPRWKNNDPFSGFMIRLKENEMPIGHIVLGYGPEPGVAELAYLFIPSVWQKGYGTEAVMAIVHNFAPALVKTGYLLEEKPFYKIVATTRTDNAGSYRIIEKAGMHLDGFIEEYGMERRFYSLQIENSD